MRIGIIICDRYKQCEGGKCFRSVANREGAFRRYSKDEELQVVAYTTCGGCPGGNVENSATKMKLYGANAIHFATGVLAGYPPCPHLDRLVQYVKEATELPVIVGTHPMPTNYIKLHDKLGDWTEEHRNMLNQFELVIPYESKKYDSSLDSYNQILEKEFSSQ